MYYNIIVIVLVVHITYIQGQTYSLSGSAQYGIRGEDYRFTCQISGGNLPQSVEFNKDGSQVCALLLVGGICDPPSSDTRATCGCISGNAGSLYLNITSVQSTDAGTWTCRDADVNGGSSQPVTLLVYYGPENIRFTPIISSITVIENESRTVTCSAECNPPPCNINWYKDSTIISSTELLSLTKRQQAGNYTCQVTNTQISDSLKSKQLMVIVHYVPVLDPNQESKTSISVGRGETGVLSIHVLAYPLPVYTWYYQLQDGSKQPVTDFRTRQGDTGLSSTLTIQDVTEDDGGKYIVYVNNSLGTRSTLFNLVVTSIDDGNQLGQNDAISRARGVGIAIGFGICLVLVVIATVLLWIFLKRSGKKICFKKVNGDKTVVHDTASHNTGLNNINLSDIPHVYDQVNTGTIQASTTYDTGTIQASTTQSTNPGYINTSPYEVLDKQTIDQQPSTYQQLSPYQNLSEDKN